MKLISKTFPKPNLHFILRASGLWLPLCWFFIRYQNPVNPAMRFANHNVAAAAAIMLSMKAGLDPELVYDLLSTSAVTSRMFEVRGPMMVAMTMTELA